MREALELEKSELRGQRPVISVTGAGGKTTTLHRLADEYADANIPVIVTTTTHIVNERKNFFLPAYSEERIKEILIKYGQVWLGDSVSGGKLKKLSDAEFDLLFKIKVCKNERMRAEIPVLIEADGAKCMPLKVPADHEPVISSKTTHVLSIYGLDSIGKKIEDCVFRPELAEKLLNKNRTECVKAEDIAELAASRAAGRKGCPESAVYTVVLNKADYKGAAEAALEICSMLYDKSIRNIIVSGYTGDGRNENIDQRGR